MTVNPLTLWIESLDACSTPQHFAMWLLAAPYSQLMTYEFTIRNRLRAKGYQYGVDYLDELLATLRRERDGGQLQSDLLSTFEEELTWTRDDDAGSAGA